MKCHSCARDYADTATFCPFCGAVPQRGAAPSQDEPNLIEADQRTVAFDISKFDFEGGGGASPAAQPPEEPAAPRMTAPKRASTVIGMPGIGGGAPRPSRPGGGAAMAAGLVPAPAQQRPPAPEPEPEKTLAIDPSRLGLDAGPAPARPQPAAEPEPEKTLAMDPSKLGLGIDPVASPEVEKTAAIDPSAMFGDRFDGPSSKPATPPASGVGREDDWMDKYTQGGGQGGGAAAGGPGRQPAKSGGNKGLLVAVIAVLLIGGAVAAYLMLGGGGAMSGAAGASAKQNLPKDVDVVFGADGDALRSSWLYDDKLVAQALEDNKAVAKLLEEAKIEVSSLEALSVGAKMTDKGPQVIAALGGKFDAEKVGAVMFEQIGRKDDSRKHDIAGATWYGKKERELAAVVGDAVLFTSGEEAAKSAMAVREGGASVMDNEGLTAALKAASGGKAMWGAVTLSEAMLKMGGPQMAMVGDRVKAGDRMAFSLDVSGDIVLRVAFIATEEKRAEELESGWALVKMMGRSGLDQLEGDQKADAEKVFDGVELTRDGATLKLTARVPEAIAKKYYDMAKKEL